MRSKLLSHAGLSVGLVFAAAAAAHAASVNLVTNGSFEQTTLSASGALVGNNLPGWTVKNIGNIGGVAYNFTALYFSATDATTVGATGTDHPGSNWAVHQAAASPDGGKFIAIDGGPNATSTLSQSISGLTVGHTYNLSFDYAGAQQNDMSGPTTETWTVSLGQESHSAPVLQNAHHGFTGWYSSTLSFTATAASEVLTFMAVGAPSGYPPVSLLDGVSLVDASAPPVPETGSWALMLCGLAAIGGSVRSRRAARSAAV
jgi:hypothetical protein